MAKITIDTSTVWQRMLEVVGLTTASEARIAESRGYEAGFYDGNDEPPSGELASYGYKRTTAHGLRDFTKISHDQLIEIVWVLYQSNPIAKRYLQLKRDYVLGRGVQVGSDDERLTEILTEFESRNLFHRRLPKWVLQLYLWGEQCYPVFVRQSDGAVNLGYIDPAEIEAVIPHPQNAMEPWAVIVKGQMGDSKRRVYRIIRRDEGYTDGRRVLSANHPDRLVTDKQARLEPWESQFLGQQGVSEYTGACFYFSINNVSNQPRGFSDLLQVADWLDSHDETLFALADREQFAGYFSWDVEVTGADDSRIRTRRKEIAANPPKRGSVNVHNDMEKWTFNYPDLKQAASIAAADAIEVHALGGLGLPRHWYAHGDGTNRATAVAQGDPTWKTLQSEQDYIKECLTDIFSFVRDQAIIAGYYRGDIEPEVTMPEMTHRDIGAAASALGQLTNSLNVAVKDLRLITRETAAQAYAKALAEMGIEYDPVEELAEVDKQQPEPDAGKETAEKANEWLLSRMNENGWH